MSEESSPPPLECFVLSLFCQLTGLSAVELARRTGLSKSLITNHLKRTVPEGDRLDRILAALGFSRTDFQEMLAVLTRLKSRQRVPPAVVTPVDPSPEECRELQALAIGLGNLAEQLALEALADLARDRKAAAARAEAEELCARLEKEPKPWLAVEKVRELQKWAVAEALAHRSADVAVENPQRARELAALGYRVAELASCEEPFRQSLLGYTLTFGENSARADEDLATADELFAEAEAHWRAGAAATGPLAEWRRLGLAGSLHRDQQRFAEAVAALDQALAIAPDSARPRLLVTKALTVEKMGQAEKALDLLEEAGRLADRTRDPRQFFIVRFNHAALLCRLGRHATAEMLTRDLEAPPQEAPGGLNRIRLQWLRGSVASGVGRLDAAEAALDAARRQLAAHGAVRESVVASVELAVLLCRRSKLRAAAEVVRGLDGIQEERTGREAMQAVQLLRDAAEGPGLTFELAERAFRLLLRAPKAGAEPSSVPLVDGGSDDAVATAVGVEDAAAVRRPAARRGLRRSAGRSPEGGGPGDQAVEEAGGIRRGTAPRKGR